MSAFYGFDSHILMKKQKNLFKTYSYKHRCRNDFFQGGANSGFSRGSQNVFSGGDKQG